METKITVDSQRKVRRAVVKGKGTKREGRSGTIDAVRIVRIGIGRLERKAKRKSQNKET